MNNKAECGDPMNPAHYKDLVHDPLTVMDEFGHSMSFSIGNVLKYVMRAEKKNGIEDYKKARWYLNWIIATKSGMSCTDAIAYARIPHPGDVKGEQS